MKFIDILTLLLTILFLAGFVFMGLFLAVSFIDGLIYLIVMHYTFIIFIVSVIVIVLLQN